MACCPPWGGLGSCGPRWAASHDAAGPRLERRAIGLRLWGPRRCRLARVAVGRCRRFGWGPAPGGRCGVSAFPRCVPTVRLPLPRRASTASPAVSVPPMRHPFRPCGLRVASRWPPGGEGLAGWSVRFRLAAGRAGAAAPPRGGGVTAPMAVV
ncbi:hypothetical protein SMALA_3433 [Streptomyces malaysiensis subsp. malaysiensis]|nr:hypothetical protein SMALA_3433 [Streptomyces malaysiensis]